MTCLAAHHLTAAVPLIKLSKIKLRKVHKTSKNQAAQSSGLYKSKKSGSKPQLRLGGVRRAVDVGAGRLQTVNLDASSGHHFLITALVSLAAPPEPGEPAALIARRKSVGIRGPLLHMQQRLRLRRLL